jgi:hypothetical protein
MNWYTAKLVFRIICGDGDHLAQFDEQLRLIRADSPEEAQIKARELGNREEDLFFNQRQQPVKWQFIDAPEIYPIERMVHGTELYSRIEEKEHAELYIGIIHQKAKDLVSRPFREWLKLA